MTKEKDLFQKECFSACVEAEKLGICSPKMRQRMETRGAAEALAEYWRRSRVTDTFDKLKAAGRLEISMEALATRGKHGALFSDEEVNFCLEVLCEAGFFQI